MSNLNLIVELRIIRCSFTSRFVLYSRFGRSLSYEKKLKRRRIGEGREGRRERGRDPFTLTFT